MKNVNKFQCDKYVLYKLHNLLVVTCFILEKGRQEFREYFSIIHIYTNGKEK